MTHIIGKPPAPKGGATFRVVNEPMGRPRFPWRVVCPSGLMLPGFAEEWQAKQCAEHLAAEFAPRDPEPAEDRSKPAPGWDVVPKAKDYEVSRADMSIPAWKRLAKGGFLTRADATAWTWKQHDAQQAWKGGES
jgi:hypothetical protein